MDLSPEHTVPPRLSIFEIKGLHFAPWMGVRFQWKKIQKNSVAQVKGGELLSNAFGGTVVMFNSHLTKEAVLKRIVYACGKKEKKILNAKINGGCTWVLEV